MTSRPFALRIAADVLLFLSAFIFPWWAVLAAGALLLFFFNNFWEVMIVGLVIDVLYGGGFARAWGVPFAASLAAVALYEVLGRVKAHLFVYAG